MLKYTLLLLSLAFSSCVALGFYTAGEVASVAITGKTIDDHVVSAVTEKECSVERFISGKKYCLDENSNKYVEQEKPKYCYRTLANVDCYSEPIKNQNDYLLNP